MNNVVNELIELLNLQKTDGDRCIGRSKDHGYRRVFGGQVIGQALNAAMRSVDAVPHSLHAYFLRPGDVRHPIEYQVESIKDGRAFAVRRVLAYQFDQPILSMSVSFQGVEQGLEYQVAMPNVPGPELLKSELDLFRQHADEIPEHIRPQLTADRPIEFRVVENQNPFRPRHGVALRHMWIRAVAPLPDEDWVHRCMLAYTSDYGFLETALMPHGISILDRQLQIASLDHSIWFHKPFRLDDWLLYVADSPFTGGGRGFVRGQIFNRQGELVASVAQEGVTRYPVVQ